MKVSHIESRDITFLMHFILDPYFMDVEEKLWEDPRSSLMLSRALKLTFIYRVIIKRRISSRHYQCRAVYGRYLHIFIKHFLSVWRKDVSQGENAIIV